MFNDRRKREQDLERELRNHLELEAEEQGGDAFAARRALGNVARIQEETRESWGYQWLDRLAQDVRYGVRVLAKNPGFAAVAILTAALGIGANTAIFSVVDAVLLHPLPYRDAGRLVSPTSVRTDAMIVLSIADYQYAGWRDQATVFDGIAAYGARRSTLTGNGDAEELRVQAVTPGFLKVLGVAPAIGRDFTAADALPRGGTVAILSHNLWIRRFGGDPAILSRGIVLQGKLYSIAGVLPRGFEFPENDDAAVLIAMSEPAAQKGSVAYFYSTIARLKPGVTLARAESDLAVIDQRLKAQYPSKNWARTQVIGLHDRLVGNVRPALLVLAGAVGLVLLIVCVNVANLLLARAIARQKEIAVRMAIGAGQGRVLRQLMTEGLLLALAGGVGGVLVAIGGVALLRAIAPPGVPHIDDAQIGGLVLAFNFAVAVVSGVLFGLAPLRGASRVDPETVLKQAGRSATSARQHRRLESLLVVAETAFALILVAGAGLLLRTFAGLTAIAPGFQPEGVVTAQLSLPYWKYSTGDRQREFYDALVDRIRTGPGVEAVGAASVLPYGGYMMTSSMEVEGRAREATSSQDTENVAVNYTDGEYFRAMGIPILEGRALDARDRADAPPVAVINQALARRYFPGVSPIGARIKAAGVTGWMEVVGVAAGVKQGGLASEARMEVFQPALQVKGYGAATALAVRSTADPRVVAPWLRAQIAAMDKDLPPAEVETMRARMAKLINSQVFVMCLLVLFAGIAIVLAAIGIYSVLAYSVERRTHEIGIRIALGARRGHIMGLVVGRGVRLACLGAAAGIAGGLGLTRYLESLLYGVTPHDPATLSAGVAVVVAVALAAAWLPARRAVDRDAATTLRAE